METSSLRNNRPHLEAVLGPLSADDDANIRAIFDEVDGILLDIARHFHRDTAGWKGTGLELTWMASGQVEISSHVSACIVDGKECVDLCITLQPSWYFGERSSTLTWAIETEIVASCRHVIQHTMKTVYETFFRATSALAAAAALRTAVQDLQLQATNFPVEHWLELASDSNVGQNLR